MNGSSLTLWSNWWKNSGRRDRGRGGGVLQQAARPASFKRTTQNPACPGSVDIRISGRESAGREAISLRFGVRRAFTSCTPTPPHRRPQAPWHAAATHAICERRWTWFHMDPFADTLMTAVQEPVLPEPSVVAVTRSRSARESRPEGGIYLGPIRELPTDTHMSVKVMVTVSGRNSRQGCEAPQPLPDAQTLEEHFPPLVSSRI